MIRIRQIKVSVLNDTNEEILKQIARKLKITIKDIKDFKINKKAIDARKKDDIKFIYEIDANLKINEQKILKLNNPDIFLTPIEKYEFVTSGEKILKERPIIVGSGPAGLFAAYILAKSGYQPLVIERGKKIDERVKDVENFWQHNTLNKNSNVQFGEGGAGTFSDG